MFILTFSGTTVLLGLAALCLTVGGSVMLLRRLNRRRSAASLSNSEHHKLVFSYAEPIHGLALCVAITASVLAINWTQPAGGENLQTMVIDELDIIETDIPITFSEPPPPPPPPPPFIEPVPTDLLEEPEPFQSMDIEPEEPVLPTKPAPTSPDLGPAPAPPPAPLPLPEIPKAPEGPMLFVEHMPTFGQECLDLSGADRKACSDKKLMAFIYKNIKYPSLARTNGIEGNVVVSFVVERDGSVSSVEPLRKVGGGCTEAAVSAIEAINKAGLKFSPGIQNERTVRVKFTMPVQFRLN